MLRLIAAAARRDRPRWRVSGAAQPGMRAASSSARGAASAAPGLFGIPRLQRPEDFIVWSREAVERCNHMIGRIIAAPHDASVIQLMDDISDEMCQVCDAAEACRNVHADGAWRSAAGAACAGLSSYLAEVNQHEGMYGKLASTMERYRRSKEASTSGRQAGGSSDLMSAAELAGFDPETALVGTKLQMDHEKSGVHLTDPAARARLRGLMEQGQHYPSAFNAALSDPRQLGSARIPGSLLPPTWRVMARNGTFKLPLDGANLHSFLTSVPIEEARRMAYVAGHSSPAKNLELLDAMIQTRSDMAALLGQPSYAHLKAADATLAGTPEAATAFLRQLAEGVRPLADVEAEVLRRLKAKDTGDAGAKLHPWDLDYYMTRARTAAAGAKAGGATPYLHLDSVLSGLSDLLTRLMGIALVPEALGVAPATESAAVDGGGAAGGGGDTAAASPAQFSAAAAASGGNGGGGGGGEGVGAEGWAPGVRRIGVVSADGGRRLGTLYLDLLPRQGKLPGSVLFPIRCGRQLPDGSYQQPILALVTPCGPAPDRAAFTWRELRTFVHEMGHAVHNMVSRTRYQHLWGTRCAQDVVEVPSHLWEHFVTDHRTLSLIARHATSREPMPQALHSALLAAHAAFPALELQQQVLLALVDLTYFGTPQQPPASGSGGSGGDAFSFFSGSGGGGGGGSKLDTSAAWEQLSAAYSSVPSVAGTHPQARFSHLTIYGASYYSYLYARCLAEAVWRTHLAADPLSPDAGAAIRTLLLEPGGAVEPLDLISSTLGGREQLQQAGGGWSPRPDALLASLVEGLTARGSGSGSGGGGGGGGGRQGPSAGAAKAA